MSSHAAPLDEAPDSVSVAPRVPDAPGVPFPHVAADAFDAELAGLEAARLAPAERALFAVRVASIVAAVVLAFALRHDVRYALAPSTPTEISTATSTAELDRLAHQLVTLKAVPGAVGGADYKRPTGEGIHRLSPLVDRPDVYVELAIPAGVDPSRFVPPASLRGRLVPLDEAGVRFSGARALLEHATGRPVPAKAYVLEQGAEPSMRNPGAMVALIAMGIAAVQVALLVGSRRRA